MVEAQNILPIYKVEHHAILSMQGDITIAYKVNLPEIFTLSDREYEAYHQAWIKAIKVLPQYSIFHKQDWFTDCTYKGRIVPCEGWPRARRPALATRKTQLSQSRWRELDWRVGVGPRSDPAVVRKLLPIRSLRFLVKR